MNYLWQLDDLKKLSNHKNHEVKTWAIHRLSKLYPQEASEIVLQFIYDKNEDVAQEAPKNIKSVAFINNLYITIYNNLKNRNHQQSNNRNNKAQLQSVLLFKLLLAIQYQ